ncbi:hypothetical protein B0H14DRAFT_3431939 [Mycena olivaceomarginata]|nr:hypothetical protein B0H14DRAFT_3431939 [Mycena olivaceomarginata]
MNTFKEASSDDFNAERLSNGFATNSKAELCVPEAVAEGDCTALGVEQHQARLRAEKLRKEDIGKVVYVKGIDMTGHVAWVNRILALSANADDLSGAMIHEIREGMPAVMKKMVTGTFKMWKDFCDAVKGVDDDTIAVETETRRLRDELARRRVVPDSPTAPLRAAFGGFNVGCGAPRAPALANSDADPFGQAAYQQQVQVWITTNPTKYNGGDKFAPYPLTPGTDAVGTGKCFDCGVRHQISAAHPCPIVDPKETYYRCVANRIIRDDREATNVANMVGVPTNVNLVQVEATADYPAHWIPADAFDQGNGDGPEV